MSILTRLQAWYTNQCNGDWEHSYGIHIESCDNPGWWVKVNLLGTALLDHKFAEITEGLDSQGFPLETRWLCCRIEGGVWHGAGDETKLEHIIKTFLVWAEAADS